MKNKWLLLVSVSLFLVACTKTGTSSGISSGDSSPSSSESQSDGSSESSSESETDEFDKREIKIDFNDYYDRTLGGITAELWGNFSGLPTEFQYVSSPNPQQVPWVVSQVYETDDDTSMEYVYTHTMETYGVNNVTYEDIVREWKYHIRDYIWVGNAAAKDLMDRGYLPPYTGKVGYNPSFRAIDAQIECEVLGMISPGMKENALSRCDWWMRSVCDDVALECSSFYSALCAELYIEHDVIQAIENVMDIFPEESSPRKISANILSMKEDTPNWIDARQMLYYQYYVNNPVKKNDVLDCEINFAMVILSLVYGNNDFKTAGQISLRAGFDNDCNAATACLMMGIALGYSGLPEDMKALSGIAYNNTNRPGLANSSTIDWSERICKLGVENMLENDAVVNNNTIGVDDIPFTPYEFESYEETKLDASSDSITTNFIKMYNSEFDEGTGLASDTKGDVITFSFTGNTLSVYALTSIESGKFEIFIDNESYGVVNLDQSETLTLGQNINHIAQCLVKRIYRLSESEHKVDIVNLGNDTIEIDSFRYGVAK